MSTFKQTAKPTPSTTDPQKNLPATNSATQAPDGVLHSAASILQLQRSIGNRAVQRLLQSKRTTAHTVQRVPNEIRSEGIPAPSLKQEIEAQYQDKPSPAFNELWARNKHLSTIEQYQADNHMMPHHSEAKISSMPKDNRPPNPPSILAHGYMGNEEAKLRGDVQGEPYDGGHLIAYNFLGREANTHLNAAPQGKNLDNGPLSLWEDKILGAAIKRTTATLEGIGIPTASLPHVFEYNMWVDYAGSNYFIGRDYLIKYGLVPASDKDKLPEILQFIKRIPTKWTAYAQPLSFPSSDELEALGARKPAVRPDTPHIDGPTGEYGIQDQAEGAGNFKARGAAEDVAKLYSEESARGKLARTLASLGRHPKWPQMQDFDIARIPPENQDQFPEEAFSDNEFSSDDWKTLADYLITQKCIPNEKMYKNYHFNGAVALLNSSWRGNPVGFVFGQLTTMCKAIKDKTAVNPAEAKLAGEFMVATMELGKSLQKLRTGQKEVQSNKANTIDFSTVEKFKQPAFAPEKADFRFEASETQPD